MCGRKCEFLSWHYFNIKYANNIPKFKFGRKDKEKDTNIVLNFKIYHNYALFFLAVDHLNP